METITQTKDTLKYNIKPKLATLTEHQRVTVGKKVRKKAGISVATYSRYINARNSDSIDIPGNVLLCFANMLHCTVDDLYNID